ncbi:bifunctional adenosylcobinamide kinase/adenosylcobinamide-phosphate guanylyltransferase [Priestia koreensis]|uniref:bifunctional adenosylcobinamide kinase/adenosylcobinamide-phosphate guanylyltransferase n=1 Tax=Priestia koreensis TaxID=284581 RepID=UPI001F58E69E|nr:bifunctional adenosylcobinamide kinase/adenosylcobinamide-phosphate guanylyltransferase [Priestia koreensis]MCM3006434.1 bifunctional adenosylcobinamide kinase/adenosylcobinamide-phosphate guanylyltransferase [Priestia koreensis]UNL83665.1 bifunctional adenosylcobinamide kinase/adenosylcobinamide-phosphate guanylyltransferase [Priestia koreensis]
MHFIIGGAFNGKHEWVKKEYDHLTWYSAYKKDSLPEKLPGDEVIAIEGIERWIREYILENEQIDAVCERFQKRIDTWMEWEQGTNGTIVVIGTEVGKGIVPMNEQDRSFRDACGYIYQYLTEKAAIVDQIWYGIPQRLKEELT